MDRLRTYKLLNSNFGCENYLHCIKNKAFRSVMSRFRGELLRLKCNEGRYNGIPFDERVCPLCEGGIETEYHFLLICPNLSHKGSKYILSIWYTFSSTEKFVQLCTTTNKQVINNMSRYIFSAMKFREKKQCYISINLYIVTPLNIDNVMYICNFGQCPMLLKNKL